MRCYSHLSDDKENDQVWPGYEAIRWAQYQSDRPAEVDGLARTLAQQAAERAPLLRTSAHDHLVL